MAKELKFYVMYTLPQLIFFNLAELKKTFLCNYDAKKILSAFKEVQWRFKGRDYVRLG